MERIVLVGGGGHCKVVIDAIRKSGRYDIAGIVDPNLKKGDPVLGIPVLGGDDMLINLSKNITNAFISVGSVGDSSLRRSLYEKVKNAGFRFPVIIHPSAVIADDVEKNIKEGTFIAASVTVNPGTKIGKNVILNTNSSVDHDCVIGDFVHIAPGASLSGEVSVGDDSHIGTNSSIANCTKIPEKTKIKVHCAAYTDRYGQLRIRDLIKFAEAGDEKYV